VTHTDLACPALPGSTGLSAPRSARAVRLTTIAAVTLAGAVVAGGAVALLGRVPPAWPKALDGPLRLGVAALIGAVVLVYTGSRVFVELDDSINVIWGTPTVHTTRQVSAFHPVVASLQSRLLALVMMVVLGLLLIAVILSSVLLSAYAGVLEKFPVLGVWIGPAISVFVHYGLLSSFFTLIYKWLPSGGVSWRYALIGGAVVALLFAAGNRALVYYFEVTNITSAFGATAGFA